MRYQVDRAVELRERTFFEGVQQKERKAHEYYVACRDRLEDSKAAVDSDEYIAMKQDLAQAKEDLAFVRLHVIFARRAWHDALYQTLRIRNTNSWDEYMDKGRLRAIP